MVELLDAAGLQIRQQPGFRQLGPAFCTELQATPLPEPYWVAQCPSLARELGLDADWLQSQEALQIFSGNAVPQGSRPLATVYSGHQFGVWAGQLGDGRALLLGETEDGQEIQLKGSGRTPYSRMADGRAVLRSSIREFLASEAMHALGIPTTRALCVIGSDLPVRRETMETAAVITRVAPSFIRFGHFEHFSYREQHDELRRLADFVIERHYPACGRTQHPYAALLQAVSERTARLLAQWQSAGFMHGVMNTDNMSILGLTIDYGPYQFMDGFDPGHVCNHSDRQGRYAFDRQPAVANWNLHALAQALLPLIGDATLAHAALRPFESVFATKYTACMAAKLGFVEPPAGIDTLIDELLTLMAREHTDYAIFWRRLAVCMGGSSSQAVQDLFIESAAFDQWLARYQALIAAHPGVHSPALMLKANPKFVLRNHLAEQAIERARHKDFGMTRELLAVLEHPCDEHPDHEAWAGFPPDWASTIQISCSS